MCVCSVVFARAVSRACGNPESCSSGGHAGVRCLRRRRKEREGGQKRDGGRSVGKCIHQHHAVIANARPRFSSPQPTSKTPNPSPGKQPCNLVERQKGSNEGQEGRR